LITDYKFYYLINFNKAESNYMVQKKFNIDLESLGNEDDSLIVV